MTTLSHVELGVLGPLQVRQYGLPVAVPGAKPRAVLTMLGLHGGSVVTADALAELLWGARPPRTAVKALQTHISSLRRALGDGYVLTEGTGWTLSTTEIDATRYKLAARQGRDAFAGGDAGQAVARFDEALALWRGVPELPDGPRGGSEKTRWIEGHAALVEDRADALLATGRAAEIIGELEAAIADAPLRERRWSQLMLALYRAGRQGEALAAFQRARSMLADELGVDPGPDLRRLEAAIVAQDAALEIAVPEQLSVVTRAVTFLLTDIEGSTAAWEADADAMATALARHDEIVEQVVTARGGRLVKTRGEGDATFSVFDRPSSAAAAAIELQEAIRHEPWALSEPMRIRVALHTGEVELRDGDYFGRAVNRAARLRSLAEGGQILCSGATAELVIDTLSDDVVLTDLGMRQLKNLARPEHVFELRLEATEDPNTPELESPMQRPSLPAVLTGPGPFVGRGEELAGLLTAWQSTLTIGARAVLVAGEPGVGKTRLAGEWSRQVYEEGAVVLYGRCDEDLGAAYQPFAEALRSLVPCLGADRLRGLRGVEALLPLVPGLTDVVPDLPTSPRSDPDTERYALFDAVVALLGAASTSAPVVLILDDLHWAAKPTLLLLRHLLRFGEQARVQIVGTYRSTDLDRSHPLAAMLADLHRDGSASRLALGGLDEDDVTAYVAEVGYDDVELARALASVTGGNPFFLIEALRHVAESGGRWDPSTLPQGVREAVSRRLSRLPTDTNKALAAAAVVGSRFPLALVEQVVGEDLIDAFDEACKAGIVIEEPGGRYRFNHALVRQSLLAELASVRRMRLHQKIATTLEAESGADDELLAELAYHYFECAWAGNAAKAVEYCRRAADQAIERLAYEGAADLYDRALHALEELDDELPDRDGLQAELLVARCEALLAAGDVGSAAGAVAQLRQAAGDSVRLAAWGTSFDGQLSMLTDPERLDEIEAEVSAAAQRLAELDDAAGEANAHTVRAACLARLGRIADAETALDQALTAARRARDHRRVNAVLAGAPLAALWGPNPVPRAGGRCLDVVRLLRITTGSPVVEATSTRCQGVLDAMRGRAAAGRQLIDSARRTLTELGMRHALLEVDQFAGIVELVADDPAAAEPHLRRAYEGFRRMGLDADTAETAAFLARTCLELGRDAEAEELCSESERLAGHALRPSIAWRTVRAQLFARGGEHDEARRVAEEAVSIAERTDALVSHGDACLMLAVVLSSAGDVAGARAAAEQAVTLFERKGAAALVERARSVIGSEVSTVPSVPEKLIVEPDNECVRVLRRVENAVSRQAWDEVAQEHAEVGSIESRRKIVGFERMDLPANRMASGAEKFIRDMRAVRTGRPVVAIRGERLALTRTFVGTSDDTPGAPLDEMLQLVGLDDDGRIALQVWFDVEHMDAAIAELDVLHRQFELDNACVRAIRRLDAVFDRNAWDEVKQLLASTVSVESRRSIVGMRPTDLPADEWIRGARSYREIAAHPQTSAVLAVRGERLALTRAQIDTTDRSPGAPRDDMLMIWGLDERGFIAMQVWFDVEDMAAAVTELDAVHAQFEAERQEIPLPENTASRLYQRLNGYYCSGDWSATSEAMAPDIVHDDRRRAVNGGVRRGRDLEIANAQAAVGTGADMLTSSVVAVRGERLALCRTSVCSRDVMPAAFRIEMLNVVEIDAGERLTVHVIFDPEDFAGAFAELDARYLAGEAAPHSHAWSVVVGVFDALNRHELPVATRDWVSMDHRRGTPLAQTDLKGIVTALNDLTPDLSNYVEEVHVLGDRGALFTQVSRGRSPEGFDAEWRIVNLLTVDGDAVNRCELFDESDIDAALARFGELSGPAHRLDNTANRVLESYLSHYAARDWDAMAPTLADDFSADDRRRVVNSGVRRGGDTEITNLKAFVEIGCANITTEPVAIRGQRLVLARHSFIAPDWPDLDVETVDVVEINADGQIIAEIIYDAENLDAAFAELDARYLAGEAAAHAQTWAIVMEAYTEANNKNRLMLSADVVTVDHRRGRAFSPGDMADYMYATWDLAPNVSAYVEVVHRLSHLGVVVTHVAGGASQQGFEAEWREVIVATVDGGLINRCEMFDEIDLDVALARFDELSQPAPALENDATRVSARFDALFNARDWPAITELYAEDVSSEDRRSVISGGPRSGRDAEIANLRAMADVAAARIDSAVLAVRGRRLALFRSRVSDDDVSVEGSFLSVLEISADNRIVGVVGFDTDDVDAAFAELDVRYIAGEAAANAHIWSVISRAHDGLNRREIYATAPDWASIDHRPVAAFAPGDLIPYLRAAWLQIPDLSFRIDAVHRLTHEGAVYTSVLKGTSRESFDAEWQLAEVVLVKGELLSRVEIFDATDLDAAIARFEEVSRQPRRLENSATRVVDRFNVCFAERDWDGVATILAENVLDDDRRRVVNSGIQRGRDAQIANLQAIVDLGMGNYAPIVVATRGDRLALTRTQITSDEQSDMPALEPLTVAEINSDGQLSASVHFNDFEDAIAELDARYLAGEAAPHAHTWSVISAANAALNKREIPATTENMINIDHRRIVAIGEAGPVESVEGIWAVADQFEIFIEAVHRLTDLGAVVTHAAHGLSAEGFDAEWRGVNVLTVEGDLISRCELFDEDDLDMAIAKFDELSGPASRLDNAASRVIARLWRHFNAADWRAVAELFTESISNDDRRRVVNAGLEHGRDTQLTNLRRLADIGATVSVSVTATRGQRLILNRVRTSNSDMRNGEFDAEMLNVIEADSEDRIVAGVLFDADDIDAAFAELDARYIAGETAAHTQTWMVIARNLAAFNRGERTTTTPDWVTIDHRKVARFAPGELRAAVFDAMEPTQELRSRNVAVHRLNDRGVVITTASQGTSPQGFEAEWQVIQVLMIEGELISRCELFDESDLDAAIARFDELSRPPQRLQNHAVHVYGRLWACFANRDWTTLADSLAENVISIDRRRVVNAGIRTGREVLIADIRAAAEVGANIVTSTVKATRGDRLALCHLRSSNRGPMLEEFAAEMLGLVEIGADGRIVEHVTLDVDDVDAAFAELDKRYLAREAAPHARVYSVIAEAFAAVNRRELPVTTAGFVSIDHRRPIAFAPGEMMAYLQATLNDAPEIRIDIETVHRLNSRGVVVSHSWHNTSQQGFDAEWRVIGVSMVEGDRITRCELYDEADLEVALARFDELTRTPTRVVNTASRVAERFRATFAARDWDSMAAMLADDLYNEDRRRVVNAGVRHGRDSLLRDMRSAADAGIPELLSFELATRGERLVLVRAESSYEERPGAFFVENLAIAEIDADERVTAQVVFGVDEVDAAFEELDKRYVAGEAAEYLDTWSVIADAYAALNRHEIPPTTPDWVNIDHRRGGTTFETGDLATYIQASWEDSPQNKIRIETVHRLSRVGAVVTSATRGVSVAGFYAEWRQVDFVTVDGNLLCRTELFDEEDLELALARFDELTESASGVENAATRVWRRFSEVYNCRDLEGFLAVHDQNAYYEDRRKGLRDEGPIGPDIGHALLFEASPSWRLEIEPIAIRGDALALIRGRFRDIDEPGRPVAVEALAVIEVADGKLISYEVFFDLDDIDAAMVELDSRHLAGEAAAHADTWSHVVRVCTAFNRREVPAAIPDWVNIDHRRATAFAPGDLTKYLFATWDLSPSAALCIEEVHRLNGLGTVVTLTAHATSHDGFDAEWRVINLMAFNGHLLSRIEVFDEDDLDTALVRFDELIAPAMRLENVATRGSAALAEAFNRRDLDGLVAVYGKNAGYDDRRKGLRNIGLLNRDFGRGLFEFQATSSWRLESEPIAIRGNDLALVRHTYRDTADADQPITVEALLLTETDGNGLICHSVLFDPDDIESAHEKLDARFAAGGGAEHARTWSVIASAYRALSRRELPATTRNWVNSDHRRGASVAPGEVTEFLLAAMELTSQSLLFVEAVHRLSDVGAVVTQVVTGTSRGGFEAEWRDISVVGVESDLISRLEVFDESDLDAAIARFDELNLSATQLENAASRARAQVCHAYNRRDVEGFPPLADGRYDDRRKGLQYEGAADRGYAEAVLSGTPTSWRLEYESVAVRGDRLALSHETFRDTADAELPITVELIALTDLTDELVPRVVFFDPDDIDAAFAELTARWIASGEVEHPDVIRSAQRIFDMANRHDWTAIADQLGEATYVSHRQLGLDDADMSGYLTSIQLWASLVPDFWAEVAEVLAHSARGVVARLVLKGTSTDGTVVEVPAIHLVLLDGDRVTHLETYDPQQRDMALARFAELNVTAPLLDNAVTRVLTRVVDSINRRDADSYLAVFTDDARYEDRRKGLRDAGPVKPDFARAVIDGAGAGWQVEVERIAARGPHLALCHLTYRDHDETDHPVVLEALFIVEVTVSESIPVLLLFDPDDIDAAFAELTARWIASGEVAYPDVIEAALRSNEMYNRHDWDAIAANEFGATYVNHRQLVSAEPEAIEEHWRSIRALASLIPDLRTEPVEVLAHSAKGVVADLVVKGRTPEGAAIEFPAITLILFDGTRVIHMEAFDVNQREQALARFDELNG